MHEELGNTRGFAASSVAQHTGFTHKLQLALSSALAVGVCILLDTEVHHSHCGKANVGGQLSQSHRKGTE